MRQMAKQSYLHDPTKVDARIDGSDIAALERFVPVLLYDR